jgi:hypothetical protein
MRAFLYDELIGCDELWPFFDGEEGIKLDRVVPRNSQLTINLKKPFIIFGLGHFSEEDLSEDPDFEQGRQFIQIWVHDEGPTYALVDQIIPVIKKLFRGKGDKATGIIQIRFLEVSQEFKNETYNTVFRYIRFQAIISKQGVLTP